MTAGADEAPFDPRELRPREEIEDTHYWHAHRREVVLRELCRAMPDAPRRRLVEIGCGIGTVATHLNAGGLHVDYVDLHEEAVSIARRRARARLGAAADARTFLRADLRDGPPVRDVDGVLLLDVIEHLRDDVSALENARACLGRRPGVLVLVTVPAFPALWSPWDDLERHQRRYTPRTLTRALAAAGLEPVRTTFFFLPLFFAASAVKALRSVRARIAPPRPARHIGELLEARSHPLLDRAVRAVCAPELPWLARSRLPLGTSILTIARPR